VGEDKENEELTAGWSFIFKKKTTTLGTSHRTLRFFHFFPLFLLLGLIKRQWPNEEEEPRKERKLAPEEVSTPAKGLVIFC